MEDPTLTAQCFCILPCPGGQGGAVGGQARGLPQQGQRLERVLEELGGAAGEGRREEGFWSGSQASGTRGKTWSGQRSLRPS